MKNKFKSNLTQEELSNINFLSNLISFEGIDGSGKTTILKELNNCYDKAIKTTIHSNNPNFKKYNKTEFIRLPNENNKNGQCIREILKENINTTSDYRSTILDSLFVSDRVETIFNRKNGIYYNSNKLFFCDRSVYSDLIYSDDKTLISWFDFNKLLYYPGLTFWLKIEPELAYDRLKKRGNLDSNESLDKLKIFHNDYEIFYDKYGKDFNIIKIELNSYHDINDSNNLFYNYFLDIFISNLISYNN